MFIMHTHTLTYNQFIVANLPTRMFMEGGKKLENPEGTWVPGETMQNSQTVAQAQDRTLEL